MKDKSVRVRRADLIKAFRQVATGTSKDRKTITTIRVGAGELTVWRARASSTIPAEGSAQFEVSLTGFPLHRARTLLPKTDPLEISQDGDSVRIGSLRFRSQDLLPSIEISKQRYEKLLEDRLGKAAVHLKPFRVTYEDLESICSVWPKEEPEDVKRYKDRVAKAWTLLSSFGATTDAIEALIGRKVRDGWKA